MPIDYRLSQASWYRDQLISNEPTVYNWINANPGKTATEITTGTGLSQLLVDAILEFQKLVGFIQGATGNDGVMRHYANEGDWVTVLRSNIAAARTWLDSHNNGLVSAMATDLGLSWEIAERLGWILEYGLYAKRIAI